MKLIKKIKSWYYDVPFIAKVWYNRALHISKEEIENKERNFIVIFDKDNNYIKCPKIGSYVEYVYSGKKYLYKIIKFKNDELGDTFLYNDDHINVVIRFVKKL